MQKLIKSAIYVIVALILLNSIFFIFLGVYKSVHAYLMVAQNKFEERPGVLIAESLDSFMVALFFIIFAIGISKLFLPKSNFIGSYELPWLKVENFSQLKYIMWEMLLTTLFVFYSSQLVIAENHLEWVMLIIPASILMLAFAFKLLKQGH